MELKLGAQPIYFFPRCKNTVSSATNSTTVFGWIASRFINSEWVFFVPLLDKCPKRVTVIQIDIQYRVTLELATGEVSWAKLPILSFFVSWILQLLSSKLGCGTHVLLKDFLLGRL